MPTSECPSYGDLAAFRRGELSADQAGTISAHLEGCAACESRLRILDDVRDTSADGARRANSQFTLTQDPQASPTADLRGGSEGPLVAGRYLLVEKLGGKRISLMNLTPAQE